MCDIGQSGQISPTGAKKTIEIVHSESPQLEIIEVRSFKKFTLRQAHHFHGQRNDPRIEWMGQWRLPEPKFLSP
jgi:hypothetical protein